MTPMMTVQYIIYTARAMSSSLNAVFVLPVPDTARKKTWPPTARNYEEHMTIRDGTAACIRSGISVYMRAIYSGNMQNDMIMTDTVP